MKGYNFNYELVCSLVCRCDVKFKSGLVFTANRMTAVKAVYKVTCGCECLTRFMGKAYKYLQRCGSNQHATERSSRREKLRPIDEARRLLNCDLSERATVCRLGPRHGDSRVPLHLPTNTSKLYRLYTAGAVLVCTLREKQFCLV